MRFSIITICYNPGEELKAAIDSVLCQQGVDVEYIIIDGGSTDDTMDMIKSYDGSISKFSSELDKGFAGLNFQSIRPCSGHVYYRIFTIALSFVLFVIQSFKTLFFMLDFCFGHS